MKKILFSCAVVLCALTARAQNVGVNTDGTAPTELLHVKSNQATDNTLLLEHTNGAQELALRFLTPTASADWKLYIPASSSNLRLYNTADRVTFLSTGTVQFNAYTTNGIVRTTGGTGTLSSTGGAISLTTEVTGTLPVGNGGTGLTAIPLGILRGDGASAITGTTGTQYGVPYWATTSTLGSTAAGTTTTLLHGNAAGAPTFGAVSLTADVTGVLPFANGGTNANLTAVNGGMIWSNASQMQITPVGTAGQFLQSNGAAAPTWATGGLLSGGTANYNTYWTGATTVGAEQYVAISRGGTNIGTIGAIGSVIYSNGTQHASTAVGTAGQVLISNGGAAPTFGAVPGGGNNWGILGNAGTAVATNFVGTTDAVALAFRTNNTEKMRIQSADGEVIIGAVASPYAGDLLSGRGTAALPFAVNGYTDQNGSGTWGEVLGGATNFSAIQGVYSGTGVGAGALGNYNGTNTANTRAGVVGVMSTPAATNNGTGVLGNHTTASGNAHMGVLGIYAGTSYGIGAYGIGFGGGIVAGNFDFGVVGWRANNANYSGYYNGNHVIANGTKTASVGTSKGNQLLYCMESTEIWFEDVGRAKLTNGYIEVKLDELFLETVFIDDTHPMHIFVQEEGESNGLIVIPGKDGFIVREKNNGTSNISFSYRIMAKRLNFQDHRFGNDPVWGSGDTRKYSQYAPPPPVDYYENVKFQEDKKKNWKPTPMPEGFVDYLTLMRELGEKKVTKDNPTK
ncbi:MAG: hypothetical protein HYY40_09580 [Bacteroidetes bacterium]|nr:hypothetical protein [Bacteroidota bacterium]